MSILLAVGSLKGSPGATTLAVTLAAVWPSPPPERQAAASPAGPSATSVLLVEADCAGGDLGGSCWLPDTPGLASLATQLRAGSADVAAHAVRLPCGPDAVLAPAGRYPATMAVGLLAEAGRGAWTGQRTVIVDVGRLEPGAPSAGLIEAADRLLLVTAADPGSLLRVAGAGLPRSTGLVLVGPSPYAADAVAAQVGVPVVAHLPWDPGSATSVTGPKPPGRGWSRRGLPAAARALALRLASHPTPDSDSTGTPRSHPATAFRGRLADAPGLRPGPAASSAADAAERAWGLRLAEGPGGPPTSGPGGAAERRLRPVSWP